MTPLEQLVESAKLVPPHKCVWVDAGAARGCDNPDASHCQGSQPVYICAICGDFDYGNEPGPGRDDCVAYCGLPA